ncbi:MAG: hypothetical protein R3F34_18540 [Planctomycetota bacterium]
MIKPATQFEPRHWGLTPAERTARARRASIAGAVLVGLFHAAATTPVGFLWPVAFAAGLCTLGVLPFWAMGFLHTLGMRRRFGGRSADAALAWWLLPWVALGAFVAVQLAGIPQRFGVALVRDALDRLELETREMPEVLTKLPDRLVGPYPCVDLRRYPNGTLRVEFAGTGLLDGPMGLVRVPEGAPFPYGLERLGDAVYERWYPFLDTEPR